MGKGSGRRPASVTEKEYEENHARIFPPKPKRILCNVCGNEATPTGIMGWQCTPGCRLHEK